MRLINSSVLLNPFDLVAYIYKKKTATELSLLTGSNEIILQATVTLKLLSESP